MNARAAAFAPGIEIKTPIEAAFATILTPQALPFVAFLQRGFHWRRVELLNTRIARQVAWNVGHLPDFLPEAAHVRTGSGANCCGAGVR